jgi:hypothetical protein
VGPLLRGREIYLGFRGNTRCWALHATLLLQSNLPTARLFRRHTVGLMPKRRDSPIHRLARSIDASQRSCSGKACQGGTTNSPELLVPFAIIPAQDLIVATLRNREIDSAIRVPRLVGIASCRSAVARQVEHCLASLQLLHQSERRCRRLDRLESYRASWSRIANMFRYRTGKAWCEVANLQRVGDGSTTASASPRTNG